MLLSLGRRSSDEGSAAQTRAARDRFHRCWPAMAGFVLGTVSGALCYQLVGKLALGVPLASASGLFVWCLRAAARPANA
jgi:uncharacterized membrane protein YoaK (UPF0700 family)